MPKRPKTQSELISQQIDFVFELSNEANLNQDEAKIATYAKMLTDLSAKQAAAEDRERTTVPRAELLDIASGLGDIVYDELRQHMDKESAHMVTDSLVDKLLARIEKPLHDD